MNDIGQSEARLRAEIDDLKRQLEEQKKLSSKGHTKQPAGPSRRTLAVLAILIVGLVTGGFFLGYLPRQHREQVLAAETKQDNDALPVVTVVPVKRSDSKSNLVLPGNIQAITEAPVLARAGGYLIKRYVDIGDRVKAGQVLAEIEAPELKQQIKQAQASLDQAKSAVQQAEAAVEQGQANTNLAKVTRDRWKPLADQGVVSKQDYDTRDAQYQASMANDRALDKAVAASRSNAAAAEANLARLNELLGFQTVRAPFGGVITVRNVDVGALVTEGQTLLFRIAQTDNLRTYLSVPQAEASSVRVGLHATLQIPDLPGRTFTGVVARTSNSLDPATRTLLAEVQVANAKGTLLPGMYTQVDLAVPRKTPPMIVPGDTLLLRSEGPQVAVVNPDGTVHFAKLQIGRDFGTKLEVLSGIEEGQQIVMNPGDAVREGAKVKPTLAGEKQRD
jgi:RND family efflux transporter MFP subunit